MPVDNRDARIACYFALSECFKEPDEPFVADVLGGVVTETIGNAFAAIGLGRDVALGFWLLSCAPAEATELFVDEYYALFKGPIPPYVVPVESVYRIWADTSMAGAHAKGKDMIMGDPAIEMLKRYKADGIEIPDAFSAYPDHVALLLEYGGLLLERGNAGAYAEFLRKRLSWFSDLRQDIFDNTDNPFYREVADLLCRFIKCEMEQVSPERMETGCAGHAAVAAGRHRGDMVTLNG